MKTLIRSFLILICILNYQNVLGQSITLTELTETDLGVKIPGGMNAMSFGDFDNDGDLDLLVSGEYALGMPSGPVLTKIFRNENGKFIEYPTNLIGVNSKNVGWIDIDHDGDLDIYVYGLSGYDEDYKQLYASKIYINNNGVFTEMELPLPILSDAQITWGDYDNDGDPDLVISGTVDCGLYYTKVYENRNLKFIEKASLTGLGYGKPTVSWFDFDKDGDLDLLATGNTTCGGTKGLSTKIFINNNGAFVDSNFSLPGLDYALVNFADYNNDGYFDILLTGDSYYNKVAKRISNVLYNKNLSYQYSDTLNLKLAKAYNGNALTADFNNDGLLDILMTGTFGDYPRDNTIPKLYINNGIGYDTLNYNFPKVKNIAVADFDKDGDLDIVMSGSIGDYMNGSTITKFYRNDLTVTNSPPVCPNSCQTITKGDSVILSWSKAADGGLLSTKTNSNSLTYNVYLKYNDSLIIAPNSKIEDGFRKIVDYGNAQLDTFKIVKGLLSGRYEWGVQTVDNSYIGSTFTPVQTFDYCTNFKIDAGSNKSMVCGGKLQLDSPAIYNAGKGTLKYHWIPATGLDNDTIPNPTATVTQNTKYQVTVSTLNGCLAVDSVTVFVNPLIVNAGMDKTIICGGTTQLDNVTSNFTGSGTLTYHWSPATSLNNDTIPNPTATVIQTTKYMVTVSTPNGCLAVDSVTVFVNPLTVNAGTDKTIICGGSVQLDSVTTNNTGTGKLEYRWSPTTGLNNDTIPNPIAKVSQNTKYQVTVSTPNGCSATDSVTVIVNPLTANAGIDKTIICGSSTNLNVTTNYSGIDTLTYSWIPVTGINNPNIANPVITANSNQAYTVTVTSPNGCIATDNVNISLIPMDQPEICIVGVDETNKNMIVWNKPVSIAIDSFYVYRETNMTNVYQKIASVSYDSLSVFVDINSYPNVQSNKYKISIFDKCGLESAQSNSHKTMHLTINQGMGSSWNLIWDQYLGFTVSTYNIYRGTTPNNLTLIGTASGSNSLYSDFSAPSGYLYYQVEVVGSNYCNPTKSSIRSESQKVGNNNSGSLRSYSSSLSNVATNNPTGIAEYSTTNELYSIYPNPAKNIINIKQNEEQSGKTFVNFFDLQGKEIINASFINQNIMEFDVSNLSKDIYFIKLINAKNVVVMKFIKQ